MIRISTTFLSFAFVASVVACGSSAFDLGHGDTNADGGNGSAGAGGSPNGGTAGAAGDANGGSVLQDSGASSCVTDLFLPAINFPVGALPNEVAIADFNGDHTLDLAVSNTGTDPSGMFSSETIGVLFGDGKGGFAAQKTYQSSDQPRSLATGDLNGDGAVDIVVAQSDAVDVSVFLNRGDGTFADEVSYWAGWGPEAYLADVDADGHLDIISVNGADETVSILRGAGDGTFGPPDLGSPPSPKPPSYPIGTDARGAAIADLDGDGVLDIAVAVWSGQNVSILFGRGGGEFAPAVSYPVGHTPSNIVAVDVDGDGALDLLLAGANGVMRPDGAAFLRNQGKGVFAAPDVYPFESPMEIAAGDVNGDGRIDMVIANGGVLLGDPPGSVDVLLGEPGGRFGVRQSFLVGRNPGGIGLGDFNHDGRLDVVAVNNTNASVSVLLGACKAGP